MDYFLTEDQKEIKKIARRIAEERVMPIRAELDETETFPWEIMRACAETGRAPPAGRRHTSTA